MQILKRTEALSKMFRKNCEAPNNDVNHTELSPRLLQTSFNYPSSLVFCQSFHLFYSNSKSLSQTERSQRLSLKNKLKYT